MHLLLSEGVSYTKNEAGEMKKRRKLKDATSSSSSRCLEMSFFGETSRRDEHAMYGE